MKRIIVMITVCCLLLSGCSIFPERETRPPARPTSPVIIDILGPDHTFCNYDAYLKFWDHEEKPTNFIHYEQIASLGEFQKYESVNGINHDGTAQYAYTLKDNSGRLFEIHVYKSKSSYKKNREQPIFFDKSDLSSVVGGYEGYRAVICDNYDNLVYTYDSIGKLMDIYFEIEGFDYGISLIFDNNRFRGNPEGSFVSRLLCMKSAPAAVEEFAQMISVPYEPDTNTSP